AFIYRALYLPRERTADGARRTEHVLTQNLIDVLELALQATQRLPGFAVNRTGWGLYACEVFDRSAAFRQEVTEHREWWPTVSGHLQAHRSLAVSRQSVVSPTQER